MPSPGGYNGGMADEPKKPGVSFCAMVMASAALATSPAAAQQIGTPPVQQQARPKFVIYSAEADAELGSSLFRVLRDKDGKPTWIAKAESIEAAAKSEADVLILVMTSRQKAPKLDGDILEALKKRKIVGIGWGAAHVFWQLGLEINHGACAGLVPQSTLKVTKSELLGTPKAADPVPIFAEHPDEVELEADERDVFWGIFCHPRGKDAAVVDVVARWGEDPNYAPIVRQGNCMLICIPVPATLWSAPYANLIRNLCLALRERKLEPFALARRELTKPGTYKFKLAKLQSPDEPFERAFYFRFDEARKITARLEHEGSNNVMLIFYGEDENGMHYTRKNARQGGELEITADISREDIAALGDRYWILNVTNFDDDAIADCKVTITVETP